MRDLVKAAQAARARKNGHARDHAKHPEARVTLIEPVARAYEVGMTELTEINPAVLADSVLGSLMRSGRPRGDGLGRTMKVEQESGEVMTFTMLASNPLDASHVARVRVWLADRLVLDVERDGDHDDHVVRTFDGAAWAGVLLAALIIDEDAARAPRSDH